MSLSLRFVAMLYSTVSIALPSTTQYSKSRAVAAVFLDALAAHCSFTTRSLSHFLAGLLTLILTLILQYSNSTVRRALLDLRQCPKHLT